MTTYYDLVICCPACTAETGYPSGHRSQWYHTDCGGKLKLGDNAWLKCSRCGYGEHIMYWRWSCSSHEAIYKTTSPNAFAAAVSAATQLVDTAGRRWLMRIIENIEDEW